jgi:hypothetical protein
MTNKQDTQFSLENCSCMEMMSQMMSPSKGRQEGGDACAEMMSQFVEPKGGGSECFEMMSQMIASCCGNQQEDEEIIKKG